MSDKNKKKVLMKPEQVTVGDVLYTHGVCDAPQKLLKYGTDLETAMRVAMRTSKDYWGSWITDEWADNWEYIRPDLKKREVSKETLDRLITESGLSREDVVAMLDDAMRDGNDAPEFRAEYIPDLARWTREDICKRVNAK